MDVVLVSDCTKLGAVVGVEGTLLAMLDTMLLSLVPISFVVRILKR